MNKDMKETLDKVAVYEEWGETKSIKRLEILPLHQCL